MKRRIMAALVAVGVIVGTGAVLAQQASASGSLSDTVVGAWHVDAIGAPYVPHLFTFNSDGTMLTTNPTNVQENPAADHGGTNDSVGMGVWRRGAGGWIYGTFYQLNAFADNHQPTDDLEVRFRIRVSHNQLVGDWVIVAFDARGTFKGSRLELKLWTP